MTEAAARAPGLLLASVASGQALVATVRSVLVTAVLTALAGTALGAESPLVVGVLGALLCAWALARYTAVVLPAVSGGSPAVAARDHHRALARRAVPWQRDPDAAGHTRSRAPSELLPAVS